MALILPILAILISILTSLLMLVMLGPSGKPLALGETSGSLPSHSMRPSMPAPASTRGWSIATVLIASTGTIAAIWAIADDRMLLACALGIAPTISVVLTFGYFLYREA